MRRRVRLWAFVPDTPSPIGVAGPRAVDTPARAAASCGLTLAEARRFAGSAASHRRSPPSTHSHSARRTRGSAPLECSAGPGLRRQGRTQDPSAHAAAPNRALTQSRGEMPVRRRSCIHRSQPVIHTDPSHCSWWRTSHLGIQASGSEHSDPGATEQAIVSSKNGRHARSWPPPFRPASLACLPARHHPHSHTHPRLSEFALESSLDSRHTVPATSQYRGDTAPQGDVTDVTDISDPAL